jgi:hypothetical protein
MWWQGQKNEPPEAVRLQGSKSGSVNQQFIAQLQVRIQVPQEELIASVQQGESFQHSSSTTEKFALKKLRAF